MRLGAYLRDKREKAGVTLKEMQEKSGIRKSVIKIMESDDWSSLPEQNHIYFLLDKYAKVLGIDSDHLYSRFNEELPEENEQSKKRQQSENEDFKYLRKVLLSFAAMIAVLFVLWLILLQIGTETDMFESTPIYQSTAFDIESLDAEEPEEASEESGDESDVEESEPEPAEETAEADVNYTGMDGSTLFYDVTVSDELVITLSGENSWVSLSDDTGSTYAYEELTEGEFDISDDAATVYLTIGNAPGQELTVGGETVSSGDTTDAITVNFQFNIIRE